MTIKVIGHRGNGRTTETPFANGKAAQQTLLSFEQAIGNGAEGVEFDVFLSRDMVPVIIDKNTIGSHLVADLDCSEIQGIVLPGNQKIPTLEQALILLNDLNTARSTPEPLFINVELKGPSVVEPSLRVVDQVARLYGLDRNIIHYSTTDRDKLSLVRELDKNAHIQPTIVTTQLFHPSVVQQPGYFVPLSEAYNKTALNELSKYIRNKGCSAIDTPTSDIRRPLLDLADRLNVGFCTHPSGPRRREGAETLFNTITMLDEFSRSAGKVILKVDDIAATRSVIASAQTGKPCPVKKLERMMGARFIV